MADFGINWGLAQPVDVGGAFQQGWERGKQQRRETDTRNALASYAKNPNMDTANALIPYDPKLGMELKQQQVEAEKAARVRDLRMRAAQGDHSALTELAGDDPQMWSKIGDQQLEMAKRATAFMGQAVLQIANIPEAQRATAWEQYVRQAEASGMDIPQQYERYSPQALDAAAAEAGAMEKLIKQRDPSWHFSPNGGLVDFNNPQSIQKYSDWMAKGAPGGVAPQAGTIPPPPEGFVIDGGPTQPASGSFRP